MFERSEPKAGNGEVARIVLPPIQEFLVTRKDEHGGNTLVKCHSLGLGRAGILICYMLRAAISHETGEPYVEQRVVRMFKHYLDVGEVDIPATVVRH